jgi:peptidoglycan hydrolase-like protein with peptidoglycan-binding domain
MAARGKAKNPFGEELIIFGNPVRVVSSRKAADEARAELEKQGLKVTVHPMGGGTFTVLGAKPGAAPRKTNPRKRRNGPEEDVAPQTDQAVRLFQKFHGKKPAGIMEAQRSAAMRLDYTALGELRAIGLGEAAFDGDKLVHHWEELPHLDFADAGVKLASAPNGKQMYLIGGDQDVSSFLGDFEGVDPEKDLIDLGDAGFVVYDARKKQSRFEPVEWVHRLGEETDELPRLMYDRIKRELFLVGGAYFIDLAPALSPGIEN